MYSGLETGPNTSNTLPTASLSDVKMTLSSVRGGVSFRDWIITSCCIILETVPTGFSSASSGKDTNTSSTAGSSSSRTSSLVLMGAGWLKPSSSSSSTKTGGEGEEDEEEEEEEEDEELSLSDSSSSHASVLHTLCKESVAVVSSIWVSVFDMSALPGVTIGCSSCGVMVTSISSSFSTCAGNVSPFSSGIFSSISTL